MAKFINIGNGAFVNANKISAIISSDADKVRRIMLKHGCDRTSAEVYDVTDDAETRSIILLNDESIVVSSVSASELNKRFHEDSE
ncbi:MAG: DUF370 domain-containing protein [Ruminococcaceae bacterium]|nr:DUF370 domain-containing protein [Oscillospiraceae bacterium]